MTYDDVWQRWVSYDEEPGELIRHYEEDIASTTIGYLEFCGL